MMPTHVDSETMADVKRPLAVVAWRWCRHQCRIYRYSTHSDNGLDIKAERTGLRLFPFTKRQLQIIVTLLAATALLYYAHRTGKQSTFPKASQQCSSNFGNWSVVGYTEQHAAPVRLPRQLGLGWSGFPVTCFDNVPSNEELRNSDTRPDHVEITYLTCCNFDGVLSTNSCRNASRRLVIPRRNAEALHALGEHTTNLSAISAEHLFVFVTGASANHYHESLVLVRNIQMTFPNRTIVYWDIGLTDQQAAEVKKLCRIVYKKLDFNKYPAHVRTLTTYAFKPLCIMETITEYPVVWWVDTSIRFTSDNVSQGFAMLGPRHGLVLFDDPGHSVWSATYNQTYQYIATDEEGLKRTMCAAGGSWIFVNTPEIFSTFFYWLLACALDERCIAPISYPERCILKGPTVFAKCHRFDQSVMTIIAANFWGFGSSNYVFLHPYFFVDQSGTGSSDARRCATA